MSSEAASTGRIRFAGYPVLALGFRPFYLLAGMFAAIAGPLWVVSYIGILQIDGYLAGIAWHSHEMLFGFATAVIAGFLLTAVRTWTNLATPTGAGLAGLAALWILARIMVLTGPAKTAALIDIVFLPVLGLAIALPMWRSRNARNFKILLVLAGLTIANVIYHLAYLNAIPVGLTRLSVTAALDLITILIAIIGGRVIPVFTANAIEGARPRRFISVEIVALGSLLLVLAGGILQFWYALPAGAWIVLLGTAFLAHVVRLILWQPYCTRSDAQLCMLPVAYAWIPITLGLRTFAYAASMPVAVAIHALTLGAMGGMMVAMMMRSALGHTGRPVAAESAEIWVFVLVQLAAIVRVFASTVGPGLYTGAVVVSAVLWSLAFFVFLLRYWPILTRPRIDGRAG